MIRDKKTTTSHKIFLGIVRSTKHAIARLDFKKNSPNQYYRTYIENSEKKVHVDIEVIWRVLCQ